MKLDVRGGKAELSATDLEVGIRVDVQGIEASAEGSAILPIGRFGSILRESTDETVRLETDGTGTVVRGDRFEFRLPAENPDEFPAVMAFAESKYHELPALLLNEVEKQERRLDAVERARDARRAEIAAGEDELRGHDLRLEELRARIAKRERKASRSSRGTPTPSRTPAISS